MKVKLYILAFVILLSTCSVAFAQQDTLLLKHHINALQQYAFSHAVEKVHLHLDRPWYGTGDTIWFKVYAVAGPLHLPSPISSVLYAELIGTNDTVMQRLTLQLNSGTSWGEFVLPYSYKSGTYHIRAYTNWMRNDSAYFYDKKILVGGIDLQAGKHVNVKTKPLAPDVQFFPEGGYLVNDLRSKVAFKAIDKNGIGINITGTITDQDGNEVASFNTRHAGMGVFALTPQPGKQYKANIICADGTPYVIDLPKATDEGFTLTLNNTTDSIYVQVAANDALYNSKRDSVFYLIAQSAGKYYFAASGKLADKVFTTQVAEDRFPSGIARFTLFSQSGEPLNERVIFVQNNDVLKLTLNAAKQTYAPKEKVEIALETKTADDKATVGSFSVSVTDETKVPVDEQAEATIFSDLLLTSDLKGNIENPNYYFINPNDETCTNLDLLMLTQGYSRFEWKKILTRDTAKIAFEPEKALSITGSIKTPGNKPVANAKVRFTSIKDFLSLDTLTDSNGRFKFTGLNLADSTKVVINAKKDKGGSNVRITVKPPIYAPVDKTERQMIENTFQSMPDSVMTALKRTDVKGVQLSKRVIQLAEVKVKDHRNTYFNPVYSDNMKFSANLNGPGNADQVILSDVITRNGGGKLSEILMGKILGVEFMNGKAHSERNSHSLGGSTLMAIFIEGAQASPNMLDDINPYDIYSIEVLRSGGYLAIYGSNAPAGALIITMKHGVDKVDNSKISVDGLVTYSFNGFYKAREFYSPKYDSSKQAITPDARETVYWNPAVITDANGKAAFIYFNAGSPGTYRVVVEGIDGYGNLGRQVYQYKVE